jgi:hypothetical protein
MNDGIQHECLQVKLKISTRYAPNNRSKQVPTKLVIVAKIFVMSFIPILSICRNVSSDWKGLRSNLEEG